MGDFLYMWTGQEKILGQKVNVKFFTVGPYVPLALVRQTILKKREVELSLASRLSMKTCGRELGFF